MAMRLCAWPVSSPRWAVCPAMCVPAWDDSVLLGGLARPARGGGAFDVASRRGDSELLMREIAWDRGGISVCN